MAAGTLRVWLVEPAQQSITVFGVGQPPRLLRIDAELDGGQVLPGFRLPVRAVFAAD